MNRYVPFYLLFLVLSFPACSKERTAKSLPVANYASGSFVSNLAVYEELSPIDSGIVAGKTSSYTDSNGDRAAIPAQFHVSKIAGEQTILTGLVVIGPDGSEFVWVPVTSDTFSSDRFSAWGFFDETESDDFKAMRASAEKYGGFYIGRYEASRGKNNVPQSKQASARDIWVHIPPQKMIAACTRLYADNKSVTVFLPWGITWDRTLSWLVETGCKTEREVASDSSGWGNYSNNLFGSRDYSATGVYEETKANNIYDLAGNFWEWTQERTSGGSYAARSGGYSVMGGPCTGSRSPAAFRSGLPGNDHHPNISFRIAMWVQ